MGIAIDPSLSEFGEAAVKLDVEMKHFLRLAYELDTLNLESDKGLNRSNEVFRELSESRVQLETHMKEMSRTLAIARTLNEEAEKKIASRTEAWQLRQVEVERLQVRFKTLGDSVHHLNALISEFKRPASESSSPADQDKLRLQLNQALEPLSTLVNEAKNLVEDARTANMKTLERNADTLRQTLQAARNRLNLLAERGTQLLN